MLDKNWLKDAGIEPRAYWREALVVIGTIGFLIVLSQQGWFTVHEQMFLPDTRPLRIALMVVAAIAGFSIGWLLSPAARAFRRLAALGLATFLTGVAILDQGGWGWSAALMAALFVFSAALVMAWQR